MLFWMFRGIKHDSNSIAASCSFWEITYHSQSYQKFSVLCVVFGVLLRGIFKHCGCSHSSSNAHGHHAVGSAKHNDHSWDYQKVATSRHTQTTNQTLRDRCALFLNSRSLVILKHNFVSRAKNVCVTPKHKNCQQAQHKLTAFHGVSVREVVWQSVEHRCIRVGGPTLWPHLWDSPAEGELQSSVIIP